MNKTAHELQDRLLAFIGGAPDDFGSLALAVYAFQRAHNIPYRAFCGERVVASWREIPAVPTRAFKDAAIACFPVEEAVAEFHTSGTTQQLAGKHYFLTLELYDAVIRATFPVKLPVISLVPENPHSSLAYMIQKVGGRYVERPEAVAEPVCLIGTAFHFVNLLDTGFALRLPPGSYVMETGGFKGRSREVAKPELYRLIRERFGVQRIINEYGMTELSSQFYSEENARKTMPAWTRVVVIDPQTGKEAPTGKPGLLRIHDLANLWSAACIQTEDWGVAHADGTFEILGRATGAEPRGCSLNAEELELNERER